MTIYAPYVIERSSRGERSYDIFSRLLMDRIVFLGSPINDDVANVVIAQLLFLQAESPERDINIYINSPGGSVYAGLAIYDTMQYLTAPVATICMGMAASMGAFLLAADSAATRRTFRSRPGRSCTRARGSTNSWHGTPGSRSRRSRRTWIATATCRRTRPENTD